MPDRRAADSMSNAIDAQRLVRAAYASLAQDDPQTALRDLAHAARLTPKDVRLHVSIGVVLQMLQRPTDAELAFNNALKIDANEPGALFGLASLKCDDRDAAQAEELARRAVLADPTNVQARLLLVRSLGDQGKSEEAWAELEQAILAAPSEAGPHAALAGRLLHMGRIEEARERFERALELDPCSAQSYWGLVSTRKISERDQALVARIESALSHAALAPATRMELLFSLGKAYDDLGKYETAMERFAEANRLRDHSLNQYRSFSREAYDRMFDGLQRAFPKDSFGVPSAAEPGVPQPIFIVGMPRSGTTLAEQILTGHSSVEAGGEIDYWPTEGVRCVDLGRSSFDLNKALGARKRYGKRLKALAGGLPFVTDKMPDNYRVLGVLAAMYPRARFIHCVRHPVDTCLSIYFTPFRSPQDYYADLEKLAFVYAHYRRMMDHWKEVLPANSILDVSYEELIQDQEPVTRRMVAFCGLEWEEACLRPEGNTRSVRTASAWQVRQPVYRTSLGRWRNYEPWLGPLQFLL